MLNTLLAALGITPETLAGYERDARAFLATVADMNERLKRIEARQLELDGDAARRRLASRYRVERNEHGVARLGMHGPGCLCDDCQTPPTACANPDCWRCRATLADEPRLPFDTFRQDNTENLRDGR